MPICYPEKERYTTSDLREIMRLLRSPEGCPWDREQTHRSIRTDFLEETHEAIEAIDQDDQAALCEELGDVLLQVIFHAQIAEEDGTFSYDDVVDGICKKLIMRHPHVFGDVQASSAEQVLKTWDAVKRKAKGNASQSKLLSGVPRSLPALMRAAKVQNRAKRIGFDFAASDDALGALERETAELREALASDDPAHTEEELGDVLFSAVNVSRFLKCDAELTLHAATDKFIRRFQAMESLAAARGIVPEQASMQELDALWDEVKHQE
ncbi:MAG: nucleoside triphosphate pyrophosphohydrolase [Clostridia bacterium]|nr:nucleoside triphosphate pyrophosphohydrolase [Clostridia bacterium]